MVCSVAPDPIKPYFQKAFEVFCFSLRTLKLSVLKKGIENDVVEAYNCIVII